MKNRTRARVSLGLVASAMILLVAAAWAHTAGVFATPTAVAVVDIGELRSSLNELKVLLGQVDAKFAVHNQELELKRQELAAMNTRLNEEGPTMTEDEQNDSSAEIYRLETRIDADDRIYGTLRQIDRLRIMKMVQTKIDDATKRVASRDGWNIVLLDTSAIDVVGQDSRQKMDSAIYQRSVIYATPAVDITNEVLTLMNNEYEAAVPAPKPAGTGRP
ncbi:MAG: OmpH family outer membrane protein [Planctomycetes bacterium]|nr:OmpH family outer membrane protein [Planctomycetota bacterium]